MPDLLLTHQPKRGLQLAGLPRPCMNHDARWGLTPIDLLTQTSSLDIDTEP